MHHLIKILTMPDNIAIVVMMIATIACCWSAFREIRINDRLIKEGKKDEIYKRMAN